MCYLNFDHFAQFCKKPAVEECVLVISTILISRLHFKTTLFNHITIFITPSSISIQSQNSYFQYHFVVPDNLKSKLKLLKSYKSNPIHMKIQIWALVKWPPEECATTPIWIMALGCSKKGHHSFWPLARVKIRITHSFSGHIHGSFFAKYNYLTFNL